MGDKLVFWLITSAIGILITTIGILTRTIWKTVFNNLLAWRDNIEKEGGIVTRDKHFKWCGEEQGGCSKVVNHRLDEIEAWRDIMREDGGVLTTRSHDAICEKITRKAADVLGEKLESSLKHHQELIKKDFEIVMLSVKDVVVEAVAAIKAANGRK